MVGKSLGLFTFGWLAVRLGWAQTPRSLKWRHVIGMGLLAGIGFTISLFIGQLAFSEGQELEVAKIAIFSGSLISGILGFLFLRFAVSNRPHLAQSNQDQSEQDESNIE